MMELPTADLQRTYLPTVRLEKTNAMVLEEAAPGGAAESGRVTIRPLPSTSEKRLSPGHVVAGKFRIESELNTQGLACVYRATHVKLGRIVALKVMGPRYPGDGEMHKLAKRELDALSKISHPNVVTVLDGDVTGDECWIAMEFLSGVQLRQRLHHGGRIPVKEALGIFEQVLDAMVAAHNVGVLHLDLKPENIMLTASSRAGVPHVKVLDLATAKLLDRAIKSTGPGRSICTPEYTAPERLFAETGQRAVSDARCDVYSAGLILYEMLAGFHPMLPDGMPKGRLPPHMMAVLQLNFAPHVLTSLPPRLWSILEKMLRKSPDDRYQSMQEVLHAVRAYSAAPESQETSYPPPVAPRPHLDRDSVWYSIAVGFVIGQAVFTVALLALFVRKHLQLHEAQAKQPQSAPIAAPTSSSSQRRGQQ